MSPGRDDAPLPWLSADMPHEPQVSAAQIAAVLDNLAPNSRALDLGCGSGRLTTPLIDAGHIVTAVDRDAAALQRCAASVATPQHIQMITTDLTDPWPAELTVGGFDAALCLGNTLMGLADIDTAVDVLTQACRALRPGGVLMIDDLAADFWPEVTTGHWQSGVSDSDDDQTPAMQMVWSADDAVFALRTGDRVDTESWMINPDEPRYRLWTMGSLRLAFRAAGFNPEPRRANHLLIFERAG